VGIFTRTFERAFGRSPHSDIGEEGSLNRRLCRSYSIEIRGHRGRRGDVSPVTRVSWRVFTTRTTRRKDEILTKYAFPVRIPRSVLDTAR